MILVGHDLFKTEFSISGKKQKIHQPKSAYGLNKLISLLDELLAEDELEDSLQKYEEFEDSKRLNNENIAPYIKNFESEYDKVKNKGIILPPEVLAFKLIRADISK